MERTAEQSNLASHLSDEQFADLLLGSNPSTVQSHLKACSTCSAEADRVARAIGSFEHQTRIWAERHAATLPLPAPASASTWLYLPQAWTAAALAVAIAAGFGVSLRNHHAAPAPAQVANVQSAPVVSPSTLKADNDLLAAIDGELRADELTPAIYGLDSDVHDVRNHSAKRAISE